MLFFLSLFFITGKTKRDTRSFSILLIIIYYNIHQEMLEWRSVWVDQKRRFRWNTIKRDLTVLIAIDSKAGHAKYRLV